MPQLLLAMMIVCLAAHLLDRDEQVGRADATVGADRDRWHRQFGEHLDQLGWPQAHHRATGGVERRRHGVRHADVDRRERGSPHLLRSRLRLDPGDVGTAGLEPLDLFRERRDRVVLRHRAERDEELAGRARSNRPPAPGDRRRAATSPAISAARLAISVAAILGGVQLQAEPVAAERVGQDDVGAGVDELPGGATARLSGGRCSRARAARPGRGPCPCSSCRSPRRRGGVDRLRATMPRWCA